MTRKDRRKGLREKKSNKFIHSGYERPKTGSLLNRQCLGYSIAPLLLLSPMLILSRYSSLCLPAILLTQSFWEQEAINSESLPYLSLRSSKQTLAQVFKLSKPDSRYLFLPTRPYLSMLPKQSHQLWTKSSNAWDYWGHLIQTTRDRVSQP